MTVAGIEILTIQPDFASAPRLKGNRALDLVDYSVGRRVAQFTGRFAQHVLSFDYLFTNRTDARALEDFFYARQGKWDAFFCPSWHADFEQASDAISGGNTVEIYAAGFADLLDADNLGATGNFIFMLHEDGTLFASQVSSVADSTEGGEATEILTLGTALPQDFPAGQCIIGILYHCRFSNDELNLQFDGPEISRCSVAITELTNTYIFDPSPCLVLDLPNGGGDLFDCYIDGNVSNLPVVGTGFSGAWIIEDSPFNNIIGDDFESYSDGSVTATGMAGGSGYSGDWIFG